MIFSSRYFKTLAAVICLSTLSPTAIAAAQIAQAPPSIDCSVERRDIPLAAISQQFERTRQLINDRQTDAAVQSLIEIIQASGRLQDVSIKASSLDGLVNTASADSSPFEQLINQASPDQQQRLTRALGQTVQIAQSLNSGYSAVKTRSLTSIARYYARLAQGQQSQAALGQALQASRFLRDVNFQAPALVGIAQGYLAIRQPQTAAPLIDQALQAAQSITNPNRKAENLAQISTLYARSNQIDRALTVARSIAAPYYQSVALLAIVDQSVAVNQIDRAVELLQTVPQADLRSNRLAVLAGRFASSQPERAAQLYNQAIAAAQTLPAGDQRDRALANVALPYAEAGQLEPALATIRGLNQPAAKVPVLGVIAATYANLGQSDRAQSTLTEALSAIAAVSDGNAQSLARGELINQVLRGGRYDQAIQIANAAPSPQDVLSDIANRAIAARRYDAALQATLPLEAGYFRDRLFVQIARGMAQSGEIDRALAIAGQESPFLGLRPRVLAAVAAQLQRAGRTDRATALFNQSVQLANAIDDPVLKTGVLGAIALEYLTANQPEKANQLLNQTIATSQTISLDPNYYRIDEFSALSQVAENLIDANQYRAAIRVAEVIPEPSEQISKLNQAIEQAINANDFAAVLPVLDRLGNPQSGDPSFKTRWLIAIADRNIQQGQTQQAAQFLNQALQAARTVPGDESQTVIVRGGENPVTADSDQDRGSFYEAIALRFARINQTSRALEVARSLQNAQARQQLTQQIGCYR